MSQDKLTVVGKALNWAAKQAGFSVIPTRRLNGIEPFFKFFGNAVVYGHWDATKYIDEGFIKNATLYSIVNRITSVSAQAAETFRVYKIKDQKKAAKYKSWTGERATKDSVLAGMKLKQEAYEIDDTHPFNKILEKPNQWQGMNEFLQMSIGFKLLTGNRFMFLLAPDLGANKGIPTEIYNLPPQHMVILPEKGNLWGVAGYELHMGEIVKIPRELILHSRYWNPQFDMNGSHLWGLSPVAAASRTLEISRMAEDRANAMMRNAGANGILYTKTVAQWDAEQASQMKKKVNEDVLGILNAEKIAVGNGDLGYINFGMKATDLAIIETEKYSDQKLANIYRVPPGLFDANANATDNNIAAWNRQLVTQACLPALADVRDDFNTMLVNAYGDGWYVDYDVKIFPEMQEDMEKTAKIMKDAWWFSGDEKRIYMGADESGVPQMQKFMVPDNLTDLETKDPAYLEEQMNMVDQQLGGEDNEQNEEE